MQEIKTTLKKVIHDLYGLDFEPELTPSPANIDADYSSNAPLRLAKSLHRPPMEIAEEMMGAAKDTFFKDNCRLDRSETYIPDATEKAAHRADFPGSPVYDVEDGLAGPEKGVFATPPGFINFTLPDSYLEHKIGESAADFEASIASDQFTGKTVICEFSDPNPFKILHVGHLYTSIVGDSISKLFEYAGAKVIRANFGGDVGLHVAKTMYALLKKDTKDLKIEDIANCYIEGTAAYDEDEKARQEITTLNKEIYKINSEKLHDSELAELYWRGRELSYDYFRDFYNSIGVKFDKYYPESTVAALGLKTVKEQLDKGVYEMSDGAVIFDGDKFGLHTRVFINKEGVPTYEAKDVGLIFTKWQDYHFDKSVVITGSEQKDYMAVVLKSVEQYAPELVVRTTHLTHGLVKLPGGVKMSSRKGNFLKAVDVLDVIRQELKDQYDSTDETVALAATKYAFLKYKMGGNIIFDPKESVKMTGNSGPYLLYSCVRAKKILQKAGVLSDIAQPESITTNAERALMKKLLEYKSVLEEALAEMAPHKVANYLYELAQSYSRFYEACPVLGDEHEAERIKLVQVYLDTMTHGLSLLGINIPEAM